MAKTIMIQGTMSNAGKSVIVAGLCRLFKLEGYKVAPFKSQNMALNSFATSEGLEIGRAQAMQAEAAGISPTVQMNPVLLKPTGDSVSQVIVNGKPVGNMTAKEYFAYKTDLIPEINRAFKELAEKFDIIVIEGAGSPAEINLRERDIVNMGLADMIDAPVLLAGDIDRGGVFAQVYGTYMLMSDREKELLKGIIINKFRGDKTLLEPGIDMMKNKMPVPFIGVLPYIDLDIDDEDSLTKRFDNREVGTVDIAAIRLPRISNYTDLDVFGQFQDVSVRYVGSPAEIGTPDLIVIPGTKNTLGDLRWLKDSGLYDEIIKLNTSGVPVLGICGGFQMLGLSVQDPDNVEGGGEEEGLKLLPVNTVLLKNKVTTQTEGAFGELSGAFSGLSGKEYCGYEIHMGISSVADNPEKELREYAQGNVMGTYIHGLFDKEGLAKCMIESLADSKGVKIDTSSSMGRMEYKDREYDRLAEMLRKNMDMDRVYSILREANLDWEI